MTLSMMRMAKYPTLKEYQTKPSKGIQRCDELLKKTPNDLQLLVLKLQLQCLMSSLEPTRQTLDAILGLQPPVQSLQDIIAIEQSIVELGQDTYPRPPTAGPEITRLWENAAKATTNANTKLDLHSLRFSRAMMDLRLVDAQHSLIQLKALAPKYRTAYMAHAALTQLLSNGAEDLQARLALSLARKAVTEKFDEDKKLDCRVPGQIFALQQSEHDLESIKDGRFGDSKQVFRALRVRKQASAQPEQGDDSLPVEPAGVSTRQWLAAEAESLQRRLDRICASKPIVKQDLHLCVISVIKAFVLATQKLGLPTSRSATDLIFIAITALIELWKLDLDHSHLLQAAYLAESLLSYQPRVHQAKVFLVYVYSKLGLISLAATQWDELSVKEIQLDTIGHIFMTRLSISHHRPFKSKKMKEADPQRILAHSLQMYRRVEDKLAESHASLLNHGQTGMLFEVYDVRTSLQQSVTRRIVSLEQRRLARMTGKALSEQLVSVHPQAVGAWLDVKDNRDFKATFGLGLSTELAIYGEGDIRSWILLGLAADSAWCLMHNSFPAVKDTQNLLRELERTYSCGFATDSEAVAGILTQVILQTVFEVGGQTADAGGLDAAPYIKAIDDLHCELLASDTQILPLRVSTVCIYLDTLRIAMAFSGFAESKKAFTRDQTTQLRGAVKKASGMLHAYSKAQASAITKADVEQQLDLDSIGLADVTGLLGKDHLITFTANVVESAKDAWLGPASIEP